jgi:DNA repair exonuclease SbcCD ATPase subunit
MDGGTLWLQIFILVNVFLVGVVGTIAVMHYRSHLRPEEPTKKKALPMLPLETRQRLIEEAEDDYAKVLHKSAVAFEKDLESTSSHLSEQLAKIGTAIVSDEMERYQTELATMRDETAKKIGTSSAEIETHQTELRAQLTERQQIMDSKLAEHQAELEQKLAERTHELEQEFAELQAGYAKKQAELEAQLVQQETELAAAVKARELKLTEHQTALETDLTARQEAYIAKQAELEQKLEAEMQQRRDAAVTQLDTKLGDAVAALLADTLGQHVDLGAQTPYLIAELEAHKDELIQEVRGDV